jgi:sulfatase modifying factor 1
MKELLFILLFFQFSFINAQRVSSVELSQEGKNMVIEYLLEAEAPQEILLYFSTDGGETFSKSLQKVSGDVGKGVTAGKKRIVWNVLEEVPELVGDNIVFMVEIAEGLIWEAKNGRPRMEWVDIPAGTFMMGSPDNEADRENDEVPHQVTLSGFKMSKYEVTFAQYDAFCEATGRSKPDDYGWGRGNRPVFNVSWNDAMAFADWMTMWVSTHQPDNSVLMERIIPRLPTEAEWEYACRAGTTTAYHTGSTLNASQANFNSNVGQTKPVGSYPPNAWGLFDMHGNVSEWCSDWYESYSFFSVTNPGGPASGWLRVLRGGSLGNYGRYCRSAYRFGFEPSYRNLNFGFRLVVSN